MAHLLGVKTRTLQYWERSDAPTLSAGILGDISRVVFYLDARLQFLRAQLVEARPEFLLAYREPDDLKQLDPDSYAVGVTPEAYQMLLWHVREALAVPMAIRYLEVPDYVRWLKGRADSLELRDAWAKVTPPAVVRTAPQTGYED